MKNKRRGPDAVVKAVNAASIVSWLIIFGVIVAFSIAKPSIRGVRPGMSAITGGWNQDALDMLQFLLILQVFICGVGLSFNALRIKRKSDKLSKSLIAFACISVFAIVMMTLA